MSYPGSFAPAQYFPLVTAPSHASCWALVGATTHFWGAGDMGLQEQWAVLTGNTYNDYCLGQNFTITASEDFPMFADEDDPLFVPPDSGYSVP